MMYAIRLQTMSPVRAWVLVPLAVMVAAGLWARPAAALVDVSTCGTTISAPGDYQVSADLSCTGDGIIITSSGVHLRMAGHVLTGSGTGTGLTVVGVAGDVDVDNGTLTGFSVGVRLEAASGVSAVGVIATENRTGMVLDHANSNECTNTIVTHNTGDGIQAFTSHHNVITASLGNDNGGAGLVGQDFDDNVLTGNGFHTNRGDGVHLDGESNGNLLRSNDASENGGDGVRLLDADGNTLKANHMRGNGGTGIRVETGSTQNLLQGNTAEMNFTFDVADLNPCQANTWKSNNFVTDSEDDGSQAGCIR